MKPSLGLLQMQNAKTVLFQPFSAVSICGAALANLEALRI